MNLIRLLILVAIVWLIYQLVRGKLAQLKRTAKEPEPPKAISAQFVKCEQCGLHVPEGEALRDAKQRAFCSAEHRDRFLE